MELQYSTVSVQSSPSSMVAAGVEAAVAACVGAAVAAGVGAEVDCTSAGRRSEEMRGLEQYKRGHVPNELPANKRVTK